MNQMSQGENHSLTLMAKLWAFVLNKHKTQKIVPQADKEDVLKNELSKQQFREIKAHLLPITLFTKINKLMLALNFLSFFFLIILLIEHASLYPLVETQYNYAEFIGSDHNFVNVIHTKHIDNEKLIESLLRRYVVEREQIIKTPSQLVEKFSSPAVYESYFSQIKTIADRNLRTKVRRYIKILRYQEIESNIRQIEIEFTDLVKKSAKEEAKINKSLWLINIKFEFLDTLRKYNEVAINPAGLVITIYNIKRLS